MNDNCSIFRANVSLCCHKITPTSLLVNPYTRNESDFRAFHLQLISFPGNNTVIPYRTNGSFNKDKENFLNVVVVVVVVVVRLLLASYSNSKQYGGSQTTTCTWYDNHVIL